MKFSSGQSIIFQCFIEIETPAASPNVLPMRCKSFTGTAKRTSSNVYFYQLKIVLPLSGYGKTNLPLWSDQFMLRNNIK